MTMTSEPPAFDPAAFPAGRGETVGPGVTETLVLVDGMGLLARSSKAGRLAMLSHNGKPTGALLLFVNSLSAHLHRHAPDRAVVCWEGIPSLNWRLQLLKSYKSGRARPLSPVLRSFEEEQARAFCAAAGLRQDGSDQFEGDDIIAAWWRMARHHLPQSRIVIISDDRDLHQLCDERTEVWPLSSSLSEPAATEQMVRDYWGCEPARLPLLRALAGDASDGIPGLSGIGRRTAARIIQEGDRTGASVTALLGALGRERGNPRLSAEAQLYYMVSDLREPAHRPYPENAAGGTRWLAESARWRPERYANPVDGFLEEYGMENVRKRIEQGKLPWPPPENR